MGKESPSDEKEYISSICCLIQNVWHLVAVSSSNPAHTLKDVLRVALSVIEESDSCFTHANDSQEGCFKLILLVLKRQRFDRGKLRWSF